MIKLETDLKSFCFKHGITLEREYLCHKCKKPVNMTKPVVCKDWVGVESEVHEECGEAYMISLLKSRKGNPFGG